MTNLVDGVNRTRDDVHMWLAPFTPKGDHFIYLTFDKPCQIALMRIWVKVQLLHNYILNCAWIFVLCLHLYLIFVECEIKITFQSIIYKNISKYAYAVNVHCNKIILLNPWSYKFQNYNKSRIHSYRGAKEVVIHLDNNVIFKGEIARACGGIEGGTEAFGDVSPFL